MAHAATDTEDKVLQEEILTPESLAEEFPLVTLKVTYLGGHPRKTERLKGTIEITGDRPWTKSTSGLVTCATNRFA